MEGSLCRVAQDVCAEMLCGDDNCQCVESWFSICKTVDYFSASLHANTNVNSARPLSHLQNLNRTCYLHFCNGVHKSKRSVEQITEMGFIGTYSDSTIF